ncbi:MAG: hypothetical protein Q7R30_11385 [Acidobacteriota bacterium]|nr:hypothetical protein [Acidobacteriota bacterium]
MPPGSNTTTVLPTNNQVVGALSKDALLALVVEMLPLIDDDLTVAVLERIALDLLERNSELDAARFVLSEALTLTHTSNAEIARLKLRLAELHDARRLGRTVVA